MRTLNQKAEIRNQKGMEIRNQKAEIRRGARKPETRNQKSE
jgi:hypothetical protein